MKFKPPACKRMLLRERLLAVVDEQREKRLFILCAAAGYGKTILLAQLYNRHLDNGHEKSGNGNNGEKQPAVWYRFDELDKAPDYFHKSFTRAVKKSCQPEWDKTAKTGKVANAAITANPAESAEPAEPANPGNRQPLVAYATGQSAGSRHTARPSADGGSAANRSADSIYELIGSGSVPVSLFFDDFHVVNKSRELSGFFQHLINNLPAGCRIFIASREKPALSLGRLRAQRAVVELDTEQLKFTPAETARFTNPRYKKYLKQPELESLQRWSDGWPLALAMFREEVRQNGRKPAAVLSCQRLARGIEGYLAAETLGGLDDDLKRLLMFSAVDHPVNPAICDLVISKPTGTPAAALLKTAADLNLMIAGNEDVKTYEFHPLLRQHLINLLQQNAGAEAVVALHRRYADAYERHDMFAHAIEHFIRGEAWEQAALLIETRGERMLAAGSVAELGRWLKEIPMQAAGKQPWLKYINAAVLARQGKVGEARRKFMAARSSFSREGDREGKFGCLIAESDLLTRAGRAQQGLRMAEEALRCAKTTEETAAATCRITVNRLCLGTAGNSTDVLSDTQDPAAANTAAADPAAADPALSDSLEFAQAQTRLVRDFITGDFKGLFAEAEKALTTASRVNNLEEQCRFSLQKTKALFLMGRYNDALNTVTASLELTRRLGDGPSGWTALGLRSCASLYAGNPEEGTASLKEAIERFNTADIKMPEYLNQLGNHYRRCGDTARATEIHRLALAYGKSGSNQNAISQSLANLGADLLASGSDKDPQKNTELAKSLRLAQKNGFKYIEMQVLCHRALYSHQMGDKPTALTEFQSALDLAARFEQNHFLAQEVKACTALPALALEEDLHQEYLVKVFEIIGPLALPVLTPLLKSGDTGVRKRAIAAAGAAGERDAIPHLRRCLKDGVEEVAEAARCELARIRSGITSPEDFLSRRERQIFGMLAERLSNAEIAKQLFINELTVKAHVGRIFNKLGMTRRYQAATYFRQGEDG